MLASRSRISAGVASGMRPDAMVPLANAPVRRCVAPIVARAGLAPLVDALKADQLRSDLPQVHIGDTVRLGLTVSEGKGKTRTQRLEGVVIAQSGSGSNTTVTVRRVFQGVGVEMNFHLHSPVLGSLEVLRRAKVRRAKLYYLRQRTGKNARLKELFVRKATKPAAAAAAAAAAPSASS